MTLINIFLAIFGLLGTLSAFGGRTWNEGQQHIKDRITKRGWVSLTCLIIAFGLGIVKEIKTSKTITSKEEKNKELNDKISSLTDSLEVLKLNLFNITSSIKSASEKVEKSVVSFGEQSVIQLEEAFKLSADIQREYDDWVVDLDGSPEIIIPGRKSNPMEFYWGDLFEYTFIGYDYDGDAIELAEVKLEVGGELYDLHDGEGAVFKHGSVRIYGNSPKPMIGRIMNPDGIENIKIKIFIRSTDATRGQEEFRKLILSSQFSEIGRRIYKVVDTDILQLRAEPNANSQIRSSLKRGSFVRVLQEQSGWCEVTTPKNRQGWIKKDFITEIK